MYNKTVLNNGIRIVTEEINHVRSVSIGIWVESGSRYENSNTNGVAHFIEHMLFKGTNNRSAFDIVSAIDSVGGVINAYTGKELTSFYVKIPDYHLAMALDLLADIFQNSLFDSAELAKEKSVVLQEIHMLEDTPDEYIHDFFGENFWHSHPLGLPILGTKDSVSAFERPTIVEFFAQRYKGDNLTITAAGNLNHDSFVSLVSESFGSIPPHRGAKKLASPTATSKVAVLDKDLEQAHVMLGTIAPSSTDELRYAAFLMNTILGGSMSSKLFQEIREKRGLAYSIHSFLLPYRDVGMLGVYFGSGEEKVVEVIRLIVKELKNLMHTPLKKAQLRAAQEQMKGNFLLSMESTDIRMTRLAKNEICFRRNIEFDEVVDKIDAVTEDSIMTLAQDMFRPDNLSMAILGRVAKQNITAELFE